MNFNLVAILLSFIVFLIIFIWNPKRYGFFIRFVSTIFFFPFTFIVLQFLFYLNIESDIQELGNYKVSLVNSDYLVKVNGIYYVYYNQSGEEKKEKINPRFTQVEEINNGDPVIRFYSNRITSSIFPFLYLNEEYVKLEIPRIPNDYYISEESKVLIP